MHGLSQFRKNTTITNWNSSIIGVEHALELLPSFRVDQNYLRRSTT